MKGATLHKTRRELSDGARTEFCQSCGLCTVPQPAESRQTARFYLDAPSTGLQPRSLEACPGPRSSRAYVLYEVLCSVLWTVKPNGTRGSACFPSIFNTYIFYFSVTAGKQYYMSFRCATE